MTSKTINLSRPLVVLILTELITIVAVGAWNSFDPSANINYLLIACPLVCLEGLYSARVMQAQKLQSPDVLMFRAIELIGLGIILKLIAALSSGAFVANLPVFDARTAIGAVVAFIVWYSMLDIAHDFKELDNPPPPAMNDQNDYTSPVDRLTRRFFVGGILLFVVGAVSVNFGSLAPLAAVLLAYFVLGLLFLPGLRFQMERHRWRSLGIQANETMIVPWVRAGLALVALSGIAALVLPTGFASGLLDAFRTMATLVAALIQFIIALLFWLISIPLHLLFGNSNNPQTPFVPPPLPPITDQANPTANPLFDLLPKLILFALVIYIVVSYFRDHPEFWAMLKKLRIIRFLSSAWQSIRRGTGALTKELRVRLPAALALPFRRRDSNAAKSFRFIRLNSLSARERILYFYLSTVRRAEERGIPRTPIQTPYEYSETLKPALPDDKEALDNLTDAFVEARYSRHPIAPDHARQVQSNWKRLQQALRAIRRAD
ncbi:MAG: DUF4129 domain-containing protein [Aggregatilineales bacterium]